MGGVAASSIPSTRPLFVFHPSASNGFPLCSVVALLPPRHLFIRQKRTLHSLTDGTQHNTKAASDANEGFNNVKQRVLCMPCTTCKKDCVINLISQQYVFLFPAIPIHYHLQSFCCNWTEYVFLAAVPELLVVGCKRSRDHMNSSNLHATERIQQQLQFTSK